jgi:hypothetical protein
MEKKSSLRSKAAVVMLLLLCAALWKLFNAWGELANADYIRTSVERYCDDDIRQRASRGSYARNLDALDAFQTCKREMALYRLAQQKGIEVP